MKTLIRADSSSTIGTGHIMRDLVLARRLGGEIAFACRDLPGNLIAQIPYPVHILRTDSSEELCDLIRGGGFDRVVFDHYGIDRAFELSIKSATSVEILSLDDTYAPHHCDILLNPNLYADPSRYRSLVPHHCTLWCGAEHLLLRDEFRNEKGRMRPKRFDLLIAMGGADTAGQTLRLLPYFSRAGSIAIVTTDANAHLAALQIRSALDPRIHLFINSTDMARIMNESRCAILTPSGIVHEALAIGLPFVAVRTASNQDLMATYLKSRGYAVLEALP